MLRIDFWIHYSCAAAADEDDRHKYYMADNHVQQIVTHMKEVLPPAMLWRLEMRLLSRTNLQGRNVLNPETLRMLLGDQLFVHQTGNCHKQNYFVLSPNLTKYLIYCKYYSHCILCRQILGEGVGTLKYKELKNLEMKVEKAIGRIRLKKNKLMFAEIEFMQKRVSILVFIVLRGKNLQSY
ncbi:AGAMOUS, partial, partial [Olea europaea subsp. europaea]